MPELTVKGFLATWAYVAILEAIDAGAFAWRSKVRHLVENVTD